MQPVHDYRLAVHSGDYAQWPLRTPLLHADGRPTGLSVPGYVLLHQYRVGLETLLITDWDCPYEEATEVLLLDAVPRLLARRSFGGPYASWLLDQAEVLDARRLRLVFVGGTAREIEVRDATPSRWRSRLGVRRID